MDNMIFNEFERDILKQLPGFSIVNFYAVAILESAGFSHPTQAAIETVEDILKDNTIGVDAYSSIHYLINNTKMSMGKVLLFENNLIHLKAHYILLSNKGYQVDAVETFKEFELIMKYNVWQYTMIGLHHRFYKRQALKFI
jgi:hypothetical protein